MPEEDAISINSTEGEEVDLTEKGANAQTHCDTQLTVPKQKVGKHVRSLSDITDGANKTLKNGTCQNANQDEGGRQENNSRKQGYFQLLVEIIEAGK